MSFSLIESEFLEDTRHTVERALKRVYNGNIGWVEAEMGNDFVAISVLTKNRANVIQETMEVIPWMTLDAERCSFGQQWSTLWLREGGPASEIYAPTLDEVEEIPY